tara:strand:+ start:352 stop:516 length:165 start_codon:yes stop_codon:yes gene_type:complete
MSNKQNYIFLKNNYSKIYKDLKKDIENNDKKNIIIKLQLLDSILLHMNILLNKI